MVSMFNKPEKELYVHVSIEMRTQQHDKAENTWVFKSI